MKEYLNAFILASMGLTSVMADQLESHTQDTNASGGGAYKTINLNCSVVSASGYEQDIKTAPASISIINKEDIMTRPLRDIGDAVQDVPGVYVEQDKIQFLCVVLVLLMCLSLLMAKGKILHKALSKMA